MEKSILHTSQNVPICNTLQNLFRAQSSKPLKSYPADKVKHKATAAPLLTQGRTT